MYITITVFWCLTNEHKLSLPTDWGPVYFHPWCPAWGCDLWQHWGGCPEFAHSHPDANAAWNWGEHHRDGVGVQGQNYTSNDLVLFESLSTLELKSAVFWNVMAWCWVCSSSLLLTKQCSITFQKTDIFKNLQQNCCENHSSHNARHVCHGLVTSIFHSSLSSHNFSIFSPLSFVYLPSSPPPYGPSSLLNLWMNLIATH